MIVELIIDRHEVGSNAIQFLTHMVFEIVEACHRRIKLRVGFIQFFISLDLLFRQIIKSSSKLQSYKIKTLVCFGNTDLF